MIEDKPITNVNVKRSNIRVGLSQMPHPVLVPILLAAVSTAWAEKTDPTNLPSNVTSNLISGSLADAIKVTVTAFDQRSFGEALDLYTGIAGSDEVAVALRRAQLISLDNIRQHVVFPYCIDRDRIFDRELRKFLTKELEPASLRAFANGDNTEDEPAIRRAVLDRLPATFGQVISPRMVGDGSAIADAMSSIRLLIETAVLEEFSLFLRKSQDFLPEWHLFPSQFEESFRTDWFDEFKKEASVRFNGHNGDGGSFAQSWIAARQALTNVALEALRQDILGIGEQLKESALYNDTVMDKLCIMDEKNDTIIQILQPQFPPTSPSETGEPDEPALTYNSNYRATKESIEAIIGGQDVSAIVYYEGHGVCTKFISSNEQTSDANCVREISTVSHAIRHLAILDHSPTDMLSKSKIYKRHDEKERERFAESRHRDIAAANSRVKHILQSNAFLLRFLVKYLRNSSVSKENFESALNTFATFAALRVIVALKSFSYVDQETGSFVSYFCSDVFSETFVGPFFDTAPNRSNTGERIFGFSHYIQTRIDPYCGTASVQLPLEVWRKWRESCLQKVQDCIDIFFAWVLPQLVLFEPATIINGEITAENWYASSVTGNDGEYFGSDIRDPWPQLHG